MYIYIILYVYILGKLIEIYFYANVDSCAHLGPAGPLTWYTLMICLYKQNWLGLVTTIFGILMTQMLKIRESWGCLK